MWSGVCAIVLHACLFSWLWAETQGDRREAEGCQSVIEHQLPPASTLGPGEASLLFVCCTGQTHHRGRYHLSLFRFFLMWSLTALSRGRAHNHCRISPDNHCGATGKCTRSKQRKHVCMFVYACVLMYCSLHVYLHFPIYMPPCWLDARPPVTFTICPVELKVQADKIKNSVSFSAFIRAIGY